MYLVLVQVTVRPEMLPEFERLLLHNAKESVARDAFARDAVIEKSVARCVVKHVT